MTKRAVISFSNDRGRYRDAMDRLNASLAEKFDGAFIGFEGEESIGAPEHLQSPYAFKIYAFEQAIDAGFTSILWLDSSVFAIRDINPIFDEIERDGYIMQEAGHYVGEWTNDKALDYFDVSRDEAMKMLCYGNAGFLGLDFTNPIAVEFFHQWHDAMLFGMFKGEWTNENKTESLDPRVRGHRHDLSCGSIIANKLGMKYKKGDEWLEYAQEGSIPKNETILLMASGM